MSDQNTLISVGIPTYNGHQYLKACLNSICAQSYHNLEIIICDDGSTDQTPKIIKEYAERDPRIKFFLNKNNLGPIENFNEVLRKSKGKYFMWVAQDDIRDRKCIEILHDLIIQNPNAVLSICNYQNLHNGKKYFVYNHRTPTKPTRFESLQCFVKYENLSWFYGLWKKDVLTSTGGYHRDFRPIFYASDFLTILKPLLQGPFVYTDKVLFYKRDTGYFTTQYESLKYIFTNKNVQRRVIRYLFFPLNYFFDFVLGTYYILKSKNKLMIKITLKAELFIRELKNFVGYFKNIFYGIYRYIFT